MYRHCTNKERPRKIGLFAIKVLLSEGVSPRFRLKDVIAISEPSILCFFDGVNTIVTRRVHIFVKKRKSKGAIIALTEVIQ